MYYAKDFRLCRYAEATDKPVGENAFTRDWSAHREAYSEALSALTGFSTSVAFGPNRDGLTLHNATVIEAGCNPGEASTFEVNGRRATLCYVPDERLDVPPEPGPIKTVPVLMPSGWPGKPGAVGMLRLSVSGWGFLAYPDPSLRRAPELDIHVDGESGTHPDVIGWRCAARPGGFRAPVDFLPGQDGQFVSDLTTQVTLRVPHEFVEICESVDMSPEQLLRGFVGDLAGIHNYVAEPRADGYGSNGSDERDMADAWFERAYGMLRDDVERRREREERAAERREEEELLQEERSEALEEIYSDFMEQGRGGHDEFIAILRKTLAEQK